MTSSYGGDPANNPIDRVRFLAQDAGNPLHLSDEEIGYLLEEEGNDARRAAARAAEVLAAKFTAVAGEREVGPLRIKYATDQAMQYRALAKSLWARSASTLGGIYAGGISQSDKDTKASNADRVHPTFIRRMQPYPVTGSVVQHVGTSEETAQ